MVFNARLAVYAPDGDRLGLLAHPSQWQASFPLNDVAALSLKYPVALPGAGLLDDPVEVAVEVSDGGAWVEPRNARYLRMEVSRGLEQGAADTAAYTMPGYASLLAGAVVLPAKYGNAANYDDEGKRKFLSATPGQILTTVLNEARGFEPGLAPGLTWNFTSTTASNGHAWTRKHTIYFEPGLNLLQILDSLASQAALDWWMEGRELVVVNADSASTRTAVELNTRTAVELPKRGTLAGLVHTALLVGDEGATWKVSNPKAPTPWGKTIKVITQGGVRDESTALSMIQAELDAGSRERFEYTWTAPATLLDWTPFLTVRPGDWVRADTGMPVEEVRVFQLTLTRDTDGTLNVAATVNDRFEDAQVRQAKRLKGIVNGASGDAGTQALPSKARPVNQVPSAPLGLVAESEGYWDGTRERALVRVDWTHTGRDVNGVDIPLREYRVVIGGKIDIVPANAPRTSSLRDFAPGQTVDVAVYAVAASGVTSEPARARLTTAAPGAHLDPPTAPWLSSNNGTVTIEWDGYLKNAYQKAVEPPAYFSHLVVYESPTGQYWTPVGTLLAGGPITLDKQGIVGQSRVYAFQAVSRNGVTSEFSPKVEIRVRSQISEELAAARESAADAARQAGDALERAEEVGREAADSLSAYDVQARAAFTRLVVTGGNLFRNPGFLNSGAEWTVDTGSASVTLAEGGVLTYRANAGDRSTVQIRNTGPLAAAPGERIAVSITAKDLTSNGVHGDASVEAVLFTPGTWSRVSTVGKILTGMLATETKFEFELSMPPDGEAELGFRILKNPNAQIAVEFSHFMARLGVGATLIEPGAVTADKVTANGLFAKIAQVEGNAFIGGNMLVDGTITADKVNVSSIAAGVVASQIFKTAGFDNGAGTKVDSGGFTIRQAGGTLNGRANAGFYFQRTNGTRSFQIDTNGNATFTGTITGSSMTGGTITGAVVRTAASGQRLEMSGATITGYNANGQRETELRPDELRFYTAGNSIEVGKYRETGWANTVYRGLGTTLTYQGKFITWDYYANSTATTTIPMLTLDPLGSVYGTPGIRFGIPISVGSENYQTIHFGLTTDPNSPSGRKLPALKNYNGNAGIAWDGNQLFFISNNTWYPFSRVLN